MTYARTSLIGGAHGATLARLLLCVAGALGVGCGGGGDGTPFPDFVGLWVRAPMAAGAPARAFNVSCSTEMLTEEIPIWDALEFEPGVLTDLASLTNPDPYVNAAPQCLVFVTRPNGEPGLLEFAPNPAMWSITVDSPAAGEAPRASLVGQAQAIFTIIDPDPLSATGIMEISPCSYTVVDSFIKLTKR
jgi:hypothetical protein